MQSKRGDSVNLLFDSICYVFPDLHSAKRFYGIRKESCILRSCPDFVVQSQTKNENIECWRKDANVTAL